MLSFQMPRQLVTDLQDDILIIRVLAAQMLDEQADDLRREFTAVVTEYRPRRAVLDLSQVTMISSVGVGTVMILFRRVREQGGELVLCGLTPIVEEVFRLCRLSSSGDDTAAFQVYADVPRALAALGKAR